MRLSSSSTSSWHNRRVGFLWILALRSTLLVAGLAAERRPWEVLRFLQQSSKFVSLPFVSQASGSNKVQSVAPGQVLWRAGDSDVNNPFTMAPLDDVVMGGASASTFDGSTGTWSGTVTDANSGGFIGIRSTPSFCWNAQACRGLEWRVKLVTPAKAGIQRFKFVLRDSTDFNGITWTTSVDLKPGIVGSVRMDFDKQVPARFARTVPGQAFRKDNVVGVQISYSKFEYDGNMNPNFTLGDVKVQLLELRSY